MSLCRVQICFFKGCVIIFCAIWVLGCFLTFFWKFLSWVFCLTLFFSPCSVPLFLWPLLVVRVFYLPALLCAFKLPLFFRFCSMCMMCIYLHVPLSSCATVFWGSLGIWGNFFCVTEFVHIFCETLHPWNPCFLFFTPFLVCFVWLCSSCPCSFPPVFIILIAPVFVYLLWVFKLPFSLCLCSLQTSAPVRFVTIDLHHLRHLISLYFYVSIKAKIIK